MTASAPALVSALLGGFATWTLLEYLIHRFLGHHGKGRNPFGREHLRHHAETSYFAPTWKKAAVATPVIVVAAALLAVLMGRDIGLAYSTGLTLMYVGYEVAHRRAHTHPPAGPYSRWMRRHHFHHHFRSPRMNHGVTTPVWDFVFRTYEPVTQVRVPPKHAMTWLVDPATREVRPEFRDDYVVLVKKSVDEVMPEPPPALA